MGGYGNGDPFLPPQPASASASLPPSGQSGQPLHSPVLPSAAPPPRPGCPFSSSSSSPPPPAQPPVASSPPLPPPASPPPPTPVLSPPPPQALPPSPPPPALSPPPPPATPPTPPPSHAPTPSAMPPPSPPPPMLSAPPPPIVVHLPPPPPLTASQPRVEPRIYLSPPPPSLPPPPPTVPPPSPSPSPAPAPYPADSLPPPPPPRIVSPPPPHYHAAPHWVTPRSPAKPRSMNSTRVASGGGSGKNIEISREAATTIVAIAGLAMLSFIGATVWIVKKKRRRVEAPPPLPQQQQPPAAPAPPNFMPSPIGSSLASDAFYLRSPGYPFMRFSAGSHGIPYSPSESGIGYSKMLFTPENLSVITNGFAQETLLGEGGFGCVYKGFLPDGRAVAVKKLKVGNGQGEREFKAEVDTISRVHHRHLVSLVGYCISDGQRMLVYDFVPNNTLYYHLHADGAAVLDWLTRIKIAAGAARGIAYLHEDCHPRIIHRDIKSSNILLDNNFEALVSDFGLARLAADSNSHVTTRVMGTFGYLAPEYALSGKLTAKSDVYSFGVVLLELITGRKPVDASQPLGDESLVEWARPHLLQALEHRNFGDLPDPRLENKFDENEMYHMIGAAASCVRHSAAMRPRMGQVVRALDSLVDSNLNNGLPPGHSEVFLEPQSEEIRLFQLREFGSRDCSDELSQASWRSRRDL